MQKHVQLALSNLTGTWIRPTSRFYLYVDTNALNLICSCW